MKSKYSVTLFIVFLLLALNIGCNQRVKNGLGKAQLPDSTTYEGEFRNGLFNGKGTLTSRNGDRYEGEFKDGLMDGRGVYVSKNGDRYEGEFKDNYYSGKGILIYSLYHYEGEFKDGKIMGKGKMIYSEGASIEGEFKGGIPEGIIKLTNSKIGYNYEGGYKNNMFNGKGKLFYPNGDKYEGDFKNGQISGKGIFIHANGEKNEGEFKDGNMNGKVRITDTAGVVFEGECNNGREYCKGVLVRKDGPKEEYEIKNGKFYAIESSVNSLKAAEIDSDFLKNSLEAIVSIYDQGVSPLKKRGTGFVIDNKGTIVTNYHVIMMMERPYINVKSINYEVKGVISYDSEKDICIIKTNAENLSYLKLGDDKIMRIGDKVFIPKKDTGELYPGYISDLNVLFFCYPLINITVTNLKPGDSGTPVLNSKGEVIGMVGVARIQGALKFITGKENAVSVLSIGVGEIRKIYKDGSVLTLEEFKQNNQSDSNYFVNLAFHYAGYSKYKEAIDSIMRAIELNKENFLAYTILGDCFQKQGELYKAIEQYKKASSINPQYTGAVFSLAGTYLTMGDFDQAIIYYNKCIELSPDIYEFYWGLGYAYASKKDFAKAVEAYKKADELNPSDSAIHYSLGLMYFNLSETKKAKEYFQKARELYLKQGDVIEAQKLEKFTNSF